MKGFIMAKKRALGTQVEFRLAHEVTYDTAPVTAKYKKFILTTTSLGATASLSSEQEIGTGSREQQDHFLDRLMVDGDIQVLIEASEVGFMLTNCFGAPTTTPDGANFKHVFKSGGFDLPSFAAEIAYTAISPKEYKLFGGLMVDGFAVDMATNGPAKIVWTIKGRSKATTPTSKAPAAAFFATPRKLFTNRLGSITVDGGAIASLTGGSFNYSNNLENVETIAPHGLIAGVDTGVATANGNLKVRYTGAGIFENAADNETPLDVTYGFETADGLAKIEFKLARVFSPKVKEGLSGPGGIEADIEWQASGAGVNSMMEVTLTNKVASYALWLA